MSSSDWKRNIEDSIKDGLIITATATEIFYVLMVANVKPPKASLDAMDIMKLADGIVVVSLSRTMQPTKNASKRDTTKNFMTLLRAIKLHDTTFAAYKIQVKTSIQNQFEISQVGRLFFGEPCSISCGKSRIHTHFTLNQDVLMAYKV